MTDVNTIPDQAVLFIPVSGGSTLIGGTQTPDPNVRLVLDRVRVRYTVGGSVAVAQFRVQAFSVADGVLWSTVIGLAATGATQVDAADVDADNLRRVFSNNAQISFNLQGGTPIPGNSTMELWAWVHPEG